MFNPIRWIRDKIAEYKYNKKVKQRIKELKEKDPYIYD